MLLEVIATCVQDALIAEDNGADRLELITAVTEGGLTPGIGMVEQVVRSVRIPVHVMVRPHSRSFVYDRHDLATMAAEMKAIASTGAAGIVLGVLTPELRIDEPALEALLSYTGGMQVTFHRAFDELNDQGAGLEVLKRYPPITRVLTSGGRRPAEEAIPEIRRLVEQARGSGVRILAGHGLTTEGASSFIEQTGVTEVHFGSAIRFSRSGLQGIDPAKLHSLAGRLHAMDRA
ncbi:copper homeostasis protein CutC [Paenibacillus filicis]|uniref:PF03932 family protein CutC n=1 Tax=Paenibacillus gyeongsangnamensis TaxID=3388067 RepID=A0ABT4QA31_9BACL|nr:copper homeostasis protein CutC [Paenibacillus filicis]MCZ8513750.1 copper homeostasis protein CutC [Paenibacillus filicis]